MLTALELERIRIILPARTKAVRRDMMTVENAIKGVSASDINFGNLFTEVIYNYCNDTPLDPNTFSSRCTSSNDKPCDHYQRWAIGDDRLVDRLHLLQNSKGSSSNLPSQIIKRYIVAVLADPEIVTDAKRRQEAPPS